MKVFRIVVHGLVLTLMNVLSILVGFGIYVLLKPDNQILLQAPAAALICLTLFTSWGLAVQNLRIGLLSVPRGSEALLVFLAAFVWAPLVFVPLHFLGRGYMTSFGNMVGLWLFQVPTNSLSLLAMTYFTRPGGRAAEPSSG